MMWNCIIYTRILPLLWSYNIPVFIFSLICDIGAYAKSWIHEFSIYEMPQTWLTGSLWVMVSNEREFTATPGSLLRARLAQLGWPCYRALSFSSVMRHMSPDRASKTDVWWPGAWPFLTVSNMTLLRSITD